MTDFEKKIYALPGVSVSAETVLHRTLEKLPRIKAVAIVIQWDDGSMDVDWSNMQNNDLCMAAMVLQVVAQREIRSGSDD